METWYSIDSFARSISFYWTNRTSCMSARTHTTCVAHVFIYRKIENPRWYVWNVTHSSSLIVSNHKADHRSAILFKTPWIFNRWLYLLAERWIWEIWAQLLDSSIYRSQNNNITKLKSNIESQFDDDKKGKHARYFFFVLGNWKIDEENFARAFKCDPCTIFDVHVEMGDEKPGAARWIENNESNTTKPPKCLLFFCFSKWKMSMEKISSSHDHICVYNVRTYEPVLIYAYEK